MIFKAYPLLRKILFQLPPEEAHFFTFKFLKLLKTLPLKKTFFGKEEEVRLARECMGLMFPNPVGLAAGLDKDAELIPIWEAMGFGFAEIGTVTPKPQWGNPKPRLFRLVEDKALINRLGFNSKGVYEVVQNLKNYQGSLIVGANIGKNKETPLEKAEEDYLTCFHELAPYADYITVNISSPNTPQLRELQKPNYLNNLLEKLKKAQAQYQTATKPLPICLKLAPDLDETGLKDIVDAVISQGIEGIIATNTTVERSPALKSPYRNETGGLSGAPLLSKANEILQRLKAYANDKLTLVGVGGIVHPQDALTKIKAGADLVQLYTGFIYEGPQLISEIKQMLLLSQE